MIPRICYPDLVPGDIEILTRERSTIVDGNVSDFEIGVINRLVKYNNPKTLFEIGTFDGRTTLNMAAHSGGDALVYTRMPLSLGCEFLRMPIFPDVHARSAPRSL